MGTFRSVEYADDLTNTDPTHPSTNPIYRGAAFRQQNLIGTQFMDPADDRVTYLADIDEWTEPYHRSLRLGADLASTGVAASHGGNIFPVGPEQNPSTVLPEGNVAPNVGIPKGVVQSTLGRWYSTLRPHAGLPLPQESDEIYSAQTGDMEPDSRRLSHATLVGDYVRVVPEKPQQWTDRTSKEPSHGQAIYALWGRALGAWEWSGLKAAQDRPTADSGPYFMERLANGIPSQSGAQGAMSNDFDLNVRALTFRAPPTPWDTGYNSENGRLVDSGQ